MTTLRRKRSNLHDVNGDRFLSFILSSHLKGENESDVGHCDGKADLQLH